MTTLLLGIVLGLFFGLTGSGGSTLAVPLLVYGAGMPAHAAVCVSMIAVGFIAMLRTIQNLRARAVAFQPGMVLAFPGLLGVPAGVWSGRFLPEKWLLALFALLVAIIAWKLLRGGPDEASATTAPEAGRTDTADYTKLALTGFATGYMAGLLGVGGGFLVVPALILLGFNMPAAVSTSMFSIALISIAAMAAHWIAGQRPALATVSLFSAGAIAGLLPGCLLARRITGPHLQRIFAIVLLLLAGFVLTRSVLR